MNNQQQDMNMRTFDHINSHISSLLMILITIFKVLCVSYNKEFIITHLQPVSVLKGFFLIFDLFIRACI